MKRIILITIAIATLLASAASAAAETCGNGVDDDSDGFADEGCWPAGMHGICESPMSCKITGDIAPKTGGLVYHLPPDLDPTVPFGPKLQLVRKYQSLYAPPSTNYRTAMGPRWTHNFQSWLDKSGSTVIVHLPTGQDVLFNYVNTSGGFDNYAPQAGYHFKHLKQATSSPNYWELRMLTGETLKYNWSSPVGKLIEIADTVANKITIAYFTNGGSNGQIDTVTDASGAKRFKFSYSQNRVSSVAYQTVSGGTGTTRVTVAFTYSSTNPTVVQIGGSTVQTNSYTSSYLTGITDGDSKSILSVAYVSATPGKVARVFTGEGGIGFDYNSTHAQCTGGTLLFFNVGNATSCNSDSDCGGSLRCGGKTGTGSTGVCYRGGRCLSTTSPSEDLITTVTPLTPCTGACAPTAEYSWNTTTLDLKGIKKADNNWTSFQRDANGLVTTMAEGDSDNDPTNAGGMKTFLFYDATNPGKVSEVRRRSSIRHEGTFVCDSTPTGHSGCKRSRFTWNATTGLLDSTIDDGWTYNASNSKVAFSYTTAFTHDSVGRRTLIAGPLPSTSDDTEFTFYTSTGDVLKEGYPDEVRRRKNASSYPAGYLVTKLDDYDYFGNAKSEKAPDATFTCRTFDANRNYLTQVREAMNGQTSCGTTHSSDLTTSFLRDSSLRLTRTTRPIGDCQHQEYDTAGRLSKIKLRDDCVAGNAGDTQEMTHDTNGLLTKGEFKDSSGTVTFRLEGTHYDGLQLNARINPVSTSYSQSITYAVDGEHDELTFENGIGKTKWIFDAQNRETLRRRYLNAGGAANEWDFGYPLDSPSRKYATVTDDLSKQVITDHDDLDRKNRIVSPDSGTTIFVFDEASRMTTMVEASYAHTFTYDYLGRKLTENYVIESCGFSPTTEVEYAWDAPPASCPGGAVCTNQVGRLAYVRTVLLCDTTYGDSTLDQMTYFGYDPAGRVIGEYNIDDTGRIANQSYARDKNGNVTQVVAPSGVVMGFTFGGAGNSDANRATTLWRNNGTTTNLLTNITWAPFGPVTQYDQANTVSGGAIRAMLTWNLAYRASQIKHRFTATGADRTKIDYTEDEKGRYTAKVYSNVYAGMQSDYMQYDWLDRPTCNAAVSGSCPTSGTNLKTSVTTYNASNDRTVFRHQDPTFGDFQYNLTHAGGTDKIASYTQTGVSGSTAFGWDTRGNRTHEDESTSSVDRRDYTYEGRRRVRTISGKRLNGINWQDYVITNTYDHRDRRVSRLDHNLSSGVKVQWFFYYDLDDRLIEVKHTPNITNPSTYSIFQFYWIGKRPVSYFGTAYPAGTVGRFFIHADESNRPLELMDWPVSGDAGIVWAINPDVFGWDRILLSNTGVYQPFRMNGAYLENGTNALKDYAPTPWHRPAHISFGGAVMDVQTESFLQTLGSWPNEPYSPVEHNPGVLEGLTRLPSLASSCRKRSLTDFPILPPSRNVMEIDNSEPPSVIAASCYLCWCGTCFLGGPDSVDLPTPCCGCSKVRTGRAYKKCIADPPGPNTQCFQWMEAYCLFGKSVWVDDNIFIH